MVSGYFLYNEVSELEFIIPAMDTNAYYTF